ncbi:hypothetical protein LF1_31940 [Rubripirellula obstinata]|uniref:Uncharacterized protein n=1 Tax=Rubripirellula obstinata TaxID=406547 RepID=A0A5B1CN10_9BACT|nr:hypothetical protein LF1_31940 [Rubripirellula obstinata]
MSPFALRKYVRSHFRGAKGDLGKSIVPKFSFFYPHTKSIARSYCKQASEKTTDQIEKVASLPR